jgi:hypothetical protein
MSVSTNQHRQRPIEGEHALVVTHTAVVGGKSHGEPPEYEWADKARRFKVRPPAPYAQHAVSVCIECVAPGRRNGTYRIVVPTNTTYVTIERDGAVLYDSRTEVPCDMREFAAAQQADKERWSKVP